MSFVGVVQNESTIIRVGKATKRGINSEAALCPLLVGVGGLRDLPFVANAHILKPLTYPYNCNFAQPIQNLLCVIVKKNDKVKTHLPKAIFFLNID